MSDFVRGDGPIEHVPLPRHLSNFSTREMQEKFYAEEEGRRGAPVKRPWEPKSDWDQRIAGFKPKKKESASGGYEMSAHVAEREYLRLERSLKGLDPKNAGEIVGKLNEYASMCGRPKVSLSSLATYQERLAAAERDYENFVSIERWQDRVRQLEGVTSQDLLNRIILGDAHQAVRGAAQSRLAALLAGVVA